MKQTIHQYVNSHLDEHGRFTATNLCDDRYATIPRPLGSEDAFHYTAGAVAGFTAHSTLRGIYLRLFIFLPRNEFQPAKRYLGAYPLYQRLGQGFQHYRLPLP